MQNDTEKNSEVESTISLSTTSLNTTSLNNEPEVISNDGLKNDTTYPEGSVDSIILHHLLQRVRHASDLLKTHLSGWVAIMLSDSRKCYDIYLRSAPYKAEMREIAGNKTLNKTREDSQKPEDFTIDGPDCIITLECRALQDIAKGNLNPQLGMLAGKIRVEGKSNLAVYLFNLIAPRDRS